MRTFKFDEQDAEALRGMGFTISDDGEVAELIDELVKLSVVNSSMELLGHAAAAQQQHASIHHAVLGSPFNGGLADNFQTNRRPS
jgi:hypothetical protein